MCISAKSSKDPVNDGAAAAAADAQLIKAIISLVPSAADEDVVEAIQQDAPERSGTVVDLQSWTTPRMRHLSRVKAAVLLAVIYWAALPLSLAVAAAHWLWTRLCGRGTSATTSSSSPHGPSRRGASRGTALVSGGNKTKALHVCRHLHRAGWRVVLVDGDKNWSCCTRFSNCVSRFHAVPVPNQQPVEYLKAMAQIGAAEKVSLFVPVSIAQYSVYEALAAELMPAGCWSCTLNAHDVALLNDKIKFSRFARKHGLKTPDTIPITSPDQLRSLNARPAGFKGRRYLLKSVHYASLSRADLFTLPCEPEVLDRYIVDLDISEERPWLLQRLLAGREYASYSVVADGKVIAHADNEAELSCLNYQHLGRPEILDWVQKCCAAHKMSGQVCFDFILDDGDKYLYCIECNPRTSTNILSFYDDPRLALAFFDPSAVADSGAAPLQPPPHANREVYWVFNELGSLLFGDLPAAHSLRTAGRAVRSRASTLLRGVDAVLDATDPLPFFALHFLQIPHQLARIVLSGVPWKKIDLCSGKVVELGGD